ILLGVLNDLGSGIARPDLRPELRHTTSISAESRANATTESGVGHDVVKCDDASAPNHRTIQRKIGGNPPVAVIAVDEQQIDQLMAGRFANLCGEFGLMRIA